MALPDLRPCWSQSCPSFASNLVYMYDKDADSPRASSRRARARRLILVLAGTRHREVASMAKTRTIVFVVLGLAGSPRQMASRQMATVLNRLSSGGIGEPDVYPVLPLGAAKGEPPMGEHIQRLGVTNAAKHPMRRTKVSKSKSKL